MPLSWRTVEVTVRTADGLRTLASPWTGTAATVPLGPVEVTATATDGTVAWSVGAADRDVRIDTVTLVADLVDTAAPVRLLRHGWQSWSPTDVATLGVDVDPSTVARFEFLQAVHHADQRTAARGELRSEWVTLVTDPRAHPVDRPLLVGFDGGGRHDGTVRLRSGDAGPEVRIEAFLGGAELAPGGARPLHGVVVDDGPGDGPAKLAAWAGRVGAGGGARTDAPYQVGWCSWYQYFHDVTEADLRRNLARVDGWPFDVVQLDDGYQRAIGDWRDTNVRFPTPLDGLAAAIADTGRRPGLWLAPFLVAPDSEVAVRHPEWIARHRVDGRDAGPLRTWWNPPWGGGEDGFMYGLDTTHPEVLDHLAGVAADLVAAGFPYLKLDFTFSPSVEGGYADPTRTPAERVRAGFEAVRRGAGDNAFLLGCGVPLSHVVGVVDAVRIGQDVAPVWSLDPADAVVAGYLGVQPAVAHALVSTVARAPFHRRLWVNDPDCLLLRTEDTRLTPAQVATWAAVVGASGGMALVSDDLALLDDRARHLLEETVAVGRASDDDARSGRGASGPGLLADGAVVVLEGGGRRVVADVVTGRSTAEPTDG